MFPLCRLGGRGLLGVNGGRDGVIILIVYALLVHRNPFTSEEGEFPRIKGRATEGVNKSGSKRERAGGTDLALIAKWGRGKKGKQSQRGNNHGGKS